MKRIVSVILSLVLLASCLVSCNETKDEGYFSRTKRNAAGRLSVSLSRQDKNGEDLGEEELKKIYDGAYGVFEEAYAFISTEAGGPLCALNSEVTVVFDIDKALIEEINAAVKLSALTDGLYEAAGGSLTALLSENSAPDEAALSEALSHTGSDKLSFSGDTLTKADPLVKIDLTSYADGYIITEVCEYFEESPVAFGTVTFNGIAGVFGKKADGTPFAVEIGNGADGVFNITDGYVAFVSDDFGTSYNFADGSSGPVLSQIAVYGADACTAAVTASVGYMYGTDAVNTLYEKEELVFEAVITEKDGAKKYTKNASDGTLYTPITTAEAQ